MHHPFYRQMRRNAVYGMGIICYGCDTAHPRRVVDAAPYRAEMPGPIEIEQKCAREQETNGGPRCIDFAGLVEFAQYGVVLAGMDALISAIACDHRYWRTSSTHDRLLFC